MGKKWQSKKAFKNVICSFAVEIISFLVEVKKMKIS